MLSATPLWKYRYTKSSPEKQDGLIMFPFLAPEYVVEAHFCLHRQTGEPLWEDLVYERREYRGVFGIYEDIILAERMDGYGGGLFRINLHTGELLIPAIPDFPDTFCGRRRKRRAERDLSQENFWKYGDGFSVLGREINPDGTAPTSFGLLDLKSLTLLHTTPYYYPIEPPPGEAPYPVSTKSYPFIAKYTPIRRLFNTHRLELPPLGVLCHRVTSEPEGEIYGPNWHIADAIAHKIDQVLWLENSEGVRIWEFDLAKETAINPPDQVHMHLSGTDMVMLVFWRKEPPPLWGDDKLYSHGLYQLWVLDLATGAIIQRLTPREECFDGEVFSDDAGVLFGANVDISGQIRYELVYYPHVTLDKNR